MASTPFLNMPVGGEPAEAALDFFGVNDTVFSDQAGRFVNQPPNTRTRTSHGLMIRVASGQAIGAVNGFDHAQTRDVTEAREVDYNDHGASPAELIPGRVTGRSLTIRRYDLWASPIEAAFGPVFEYTQLGDQNRPFTLRTIWRSPAGRDKPGGGFTPGARRVYEYVGCYFTRFGRNASTTSDRIINVDAEITYVARRRIQ